HEFTGRISRGHFIEKLPGDPVQFCMVGGKWTTFRAFAEETADAVLAELGRPRLRDTLGLQIGGGQGYPSDPAALELELVERFAIPAARAGHLVDAYGTRAREVMGFCAGRPDDTPLDAATRITSAEIVYLTRHEQVVRLADLLLRRT